MGYLTGLVVWPIVTALLRWGLSATDVGWTVWQCAVITGILGIFLLLGEIRQDGCVKLGWTWDWCGKKSTAYRTGSGISAEKLDATDDFEGGGKQPNPSSLQILKNERGVQHDL